MHCVVETNNVALDSTANDWGDKVTEKQLKKISAACAAVLMIFFFLTLLKATHLVWSKAALGREITIEAFAPVMTTIVFA